MSWPRRAWRGLDSRAADRALAVMVLVSSLGVIYIGREQSVQADCNARYNERSAAYQRARVAAAEHDRDALNTLVRALVDDNTADGREQVDRYLAAIERTDRERAANPVPAPPPDLCN